MSFVDDFFNTLEVYNNTFWPMTVFTYLLGFVALYLAARKSRSSDKIVSAILGFLWIWSGAVFCIVFYGPMDVEFLGLTMRGIWYLVGFLFVVQGILFFWSGVLRESLSFGVGGDGYSIVGAIIVIYSMVIYPIIGFLTEMEYPRYPVFGAAPCPVGIFTFGLLLWTEKKVPLVTAVIPLIWALMGVMSVMGLNIWADLGLILSGLVGFPLILLHNPKIGT
ncbi:hypothetical protein GWN63_03920 [Candidatus Bathyarchaeota archaeon]|nr:hypothetical protein [Candidatus Bathyarchaeota archaeon]NIR15969.1 hypothetical protein [Desulfobacterales bacterium]NIU81377.1 hypothetical protein [Candidatus Bathyarchaeota archaeon]NIV67997.1 hypothetical protein [Candidatus Bathyarchaeota archaeon]NIW34537.1 hypothetical protein [Candidatus Bathyarchaeota archaeon]